MIYLKGYLVAGLLSLATLVLKGGNYQVEISGMNNGIKLSHVSSSENTKFSDASRRPNGYAWRFTSAAPRDNSAWETIVINFTPDRMGEISIDLKAQTNSATWVGYDEIKVDGAIIHNGGFEQTTGFGFAFWDSLNENISTQGAYAGKSYAVASGKFPVTQYIKVTKNRPVKITIYAKNAEINHKATAKFAFDYRYYHRRADHYFSYINPLIKLLPLDDRGLRSGSFNPCYPGITPPLRVYPKYSITTGKNLENVRVPVTLRNESNIYKVFPLRFGLPLAKGKFFSTTNWVVKDHNNKIIPAQFYALAFWQDKSIKSLLVNFQTTLKSKEEKIYHIESTIQTPSSITSPLKFHETDKDIQVETGTLKVKIDKITGSLLNEVWIADKYLGRFLSKGFLLTDSDGREVEPRTRNTVTTVIEESGPVSLTIRRQGSLCRWETPIMDYCVRMRFYANSPVVEFDMSFINSTKDFEFTDFTSLETSFHPAGGVNTLNKFLGKHAYIFQQHDQKLVQNNEVFNAKWSGYCSINAKNGNINAQMVEAWQRYPKMVAVDGQKIVFGILPKLPNHTFGNDLPGYLRHNFCEGKYRFKQGTGFRQILKIDFLGKQSEKELTAQNIVPVLPTSYIASTSVYPQIRDDKLDKFHKQQLNHATELLNKRQQLRAYGFMNYGDDVDKNSFLWNNGCGNLDYNLFMHFLRTGNSKWFRAAINTATHRALTDTINSSYDPGTIGAQWPAAAMHTGYIGKQKFSVPWSYPLGGILDQKSRIIETRGGTAAWEIAGDPVIFGTTLLSGDQLLYYCVPGFKRMGKNEHYSAMVLRSLLALYKTSGDNRYYYAAEKIVNIIISERIPRGAWPHRLDPVHGRAAKKGDTFGNEIGAIADLLGALYEYYKITPTPQVANALNEVGEFVINLYDFSSGNWPASASSDGKVYKRDNKNSPLKILHTLSIITDTPNPKLQAIIKDVNSKSF